MKRWSFPSRAVLFSFQDFRATAGSTGLWSWVNLHSLILGGDSHTSVWSTNALGVVPLQRLLGAPAELFVITNSSPADRTADALIQFSHQRVPSVLLQKQRGTHRLFWKDELRSGGGAFLPFSGLLLQSGYESEWDVKTWKLVLIMFW